MSFRPAWILLPFLGAGPVFAMPVRVELPAGESAEAWRVPLALAELEAGGTIVVHFVPAGGAWEIEVVGPDGAQRRATVAAPVDAGSREDVAFLAASLVRDLSRSAVGRAVGSPPPAPPVVRSSPSAPRRRPPPGSPPQEPTATAAPPEDATSTLVVPAPHPEAPAPSPTTAPGPAPVPASALPVADDIPPDLDEPAPPPHRFRSPRVWPVVLGLGPTLRLTPSSRIDTALAGFAGLSRRQTGPFRLATGTVAAPTRVSTGADAEEAGLLARAQALRADGVAPALVLADVRAGLATPGPEAVHQELRALLVQLLIVSGDGEAATGVATEYLSRGGPRADEVATALATLAGSVRP